MKDAKVAMQKQFKDVKIGDIEVPSSLLICLG
jgi:hypothetical protein